MMLNLRMEKKEKKRGEKKQNLIFPFVTECITGRRN